VRSSITSSDRDLPVPQLLERSVHSGQVPSAMSQDRNALEALSVRECSVGNCHYRCF